MYSIRLMEFHDLLEGKFIERINRFTVLLKYKDSNILCHLHDSGRLKEILIPNTKILFRKVKRNNRKTEYDVLAAENRGNWVIIDSRIPNIILKKLIEFSLINYKIVDENVRCGDSIIDFLLERNGKKYLTEVKGCTLYKNEYALFPDAPTIRGYKQLINMMNLCKENPLLIFIIMRNDPKILSINKEIDPKFYEAIKIALSKNLKVECYKIALEENTIYFKGEIPFLIK